MNLHAYFAKYKTETIADIATRAGSSLAYLQHCKYGNRRMSADLALWLEWASNGEMTAAELRPDLPWPQLKPRNEQAADRANDPPLMPANNRESRHASHAENPMQP